MRRVPVTRLADLTPLDRLGIPVFCAVTPLARDLTSHMGKGTDPTAARVSALMEAIERVSAERLAQAPVRASFKDLRARERGVLDPRIFDLPDDTTFSADASIAWARGWDLMGSGPVWLPADLVLSPPSDGLLRDVDTNGLAAGNTLLEAVVHGLCEVIERDAVGQRLFGSFFADNEDAVPQIRRIDPATVPVSVRNLIARIETEGLEIEIGDITTEIGIATFQSRLADRAYPSSRGVEARHFVGYGTDVCAEAAMLRAVTEAVQSRLAVIHASRDSFNRTPASWLAVTSRTHVNELQAGPLVSFDTVPSFESDDLLEDLDYLLGRLRRAGFPHVVVADLTRPEFRVPVVRVRVAGLSSFLVNRRRIGWRCRRYLL